MARWWRGLADGGGRVSMNTYMRNVKATIEGMGRGASFIVDDGDPTYHLDEGAFCMLATPCMRRASSGGEMEPCKARGCRVASARACRRAS